MSCFVSRFLEENSFAYGSSLLPALLPADHAKLTESELQTVHTNIKVRLLCLARASIMLLAEAGVLSCSEEKACEHVSSDKLAE